MKPNVKIAVDGEIEQMQRRSASQYEFARSYDVYWEHGDHSLDHTIAWIQESARIRSVAARAVYEAIYLERK